MLHATVPASLFPQQILPASEPTDAPYAAAMQTLRVPVPPWRQQVPLPHPP